MSAIFFIPFTGIYQHSAAETSVKRLLQKNNIDVKTITCGALYMGSCATLSALGHYGTTDQQKIRQICRQCTKIGAKLLPDGIAMTELFKQVDQAISEVEIPKILESVTEQNYFEFEYDGIKFGRLAGYQLLLRFKKSDLNISANEWPFFKSELKNTIQTYFTLKAYMKENQPPKTVFIYNTLYSVNAITRHLFERNGSTVYCLHAGPNLKHFYDSLLITKHHTINWIETNKKIWRNFKSRPMSKISLQFVEDHFDELMTGKSVFAYSSAANPDSVDPRRYFNIPASEKIILVAMSSQDEMYAAIQCGARKPPNDLFFKTQLEWIKSLLMFAEQRNDLQFIVRIHPRELPNKREGQQSAHSFELFELLKTRTKNVHLNIPSDNFAIYQMIAASDLILTSWSSAGIEGSFYGLPVLAYSADLQDCPDDIFEIAADRASYFEKIDVLLETGWQISRSITAARWYAFIQYDNCVHFESKSPLLRLIRKTKGASRILNKVAPGLIPELNVRQIKQSPRVLEMLHKKEENPAVHVNFDTKPLSAGVELLELKSCLRRIGTKSFGDEKNWPKGFKQMFQ